MNDTPTDRKLLLFDVDGTLILTAGLGKKAMIAAAKDIYPEAIHFDFLRFSGMTDRLIVGELLKGNNLAVDDMETAIDRILDRYLERLGETIEPEAVTVLPGIRKLLEHVTKNGDYAVGLVTGNIVAGAQTKLGPPNLMSYFNFGAFGDDGADRNLLPPIAVERAEEIHKETFAPENVWIIGDTPNDIRCAKVNNYRALATATGGFSMDELHEHQPDALLENLENTDEVLSVFQK